MKSRRLFLSVMAGAVALAGIAAQPAVSAELPKEFRVGFQKGGILAVVKQRGAIESRLAKLGVPNVRWIEFQFGPPMMEALGLGSIDIGSVGDTPPIFAQTAGAAVVYVAYTPATANAILVAENSTIRSVADLKGKKVAIARGSSSHNFTLQALKKNGLAFGDITPAYLSPADAIAAFARGSVDAWTVWDPYFALAELRNKARPIATTAEDYASNSFYLANKNFAVKYGETLAAVVEELQATFAWADKNRDEVATLISEVTGVEIAAQKRTIDRTVIELNPIDDKVIAQQQEIADTFRALELIPRPIVVKDAVWRAPKAS